MTSGASPAMICCCLRNILKQQNVDVLRDTDYHGGIYHHKLLCLFTLWRDGTYLAGLLVTFRDALFVAFQNLVENARRERGIPANPNERMLTKHRSLALVHTTELHTQLVFSCVEVEAGSSSDGDATPQGRGQIDVSCVVYVMFFALDNIFCSHPCCRSRRRSKRKRTFPMPTNLLLHLHSYHSKMWHCWYVRVTSNTCVLEEIC